MENGFGQPNYSNPKQVIFASDTMKDHFYFVFFKRKSKDKNSLIHHSHELL